ncbi:hypothetical protein DUNSADRAFT_7571 [Dunaliella salina]|uniref:Disease resistance R13L4/SHOC-2-like LRR domain-containing protein n=1 Tax=Dunaliella salina TaxID=3046 RepID=A0ABQ7GL52_DUNSA|nr:hypothetical protein DUNSADRAFT_7571 [Dunaliella salina]|eukprot:KAF5835339.1 hypothetical protein DUNSADRAFT_7571 [Dunaliella salina]
MWRRLSFNFSKRVKYQLAMYRRACWRDNMELSLAGNCLDTLPPQLGRLQNLKRLGLAGNRLQELPDALGQLEQLEGLWLHGNLLKELPAPALVGLTRLTTLVVSGNQLTSLPDTLGSCTSLQELTAAGNLLGSLPPSIGNLQGLRRLVLNGNRLEQLPAGMAGLISLKELWLQGNAMDGSCLAMWLPHLRALEQLSLADNQLTQLPVPLSKLPELTKLWVYGNSLRDPFDMDAHPKLQSCWLEGNPFTGSATAQMLRDASNMPSLRHLGLDLAHMMQAVDSIGLEALEALVSGAERCLKVAGSVAGDTNHDLSSGVCGGTSTTATTGTSPTGSGSSSSIDGLASPNLGPGYFKLALGPCTMPIRDRLAQSRLQGSSVSEPATHGAPPGSPPEGKVQSELLVVAFGSAPGTPNWAGLLSRLYKAAQSDAERDFDVLYVVDPARSWFGGLDADDDNALASSSRSSSSSSNISNNSKSNNATSASESSDTSRVASSLGACSSGRVGDLQNDASIFSRQGASLQYYNERTSRYTRRYKHVLMLGDSMGATASLLFSPLATSVIAFCPQVDLNTACMRPGASDAQLAQLQDNVLAAVKSSQAAIHVHTGTWEHDLEQAKLLPEDKVAHKVYNLDSHRVAIYLESQAKLLPLVQEVMLNSMGISAKKNVRISNVL